MFPSQVKKESQCVWETWSSVYTTKRWKPLTTSQTWKIWGGTMCIAAEELTTTSASSEVLFVKEVDSLVHLVMQPKRTHDVREFLKHCDKGNHSIYSPNNSYMVSSQAHPHIYCCSLVSLFNGISTFVGYLMPKSTM